MEPAIDQILSENRVKISQLAQQDEPTWETLAQPMQATEDRLERAWSVISHLNGVMNSDDLRKVYKSCLEKLTEYSTELSQNAELCEAYKKLAASDQYNELSEAQRKSVDNTLRDFHLGGVDLPQEKERAVRQSVDGAVGALQPSATMFWMPPNTGSSTSPMWKSWRVFLRAHSMAPGRQRNRRIWTAM